MLENIINFIYCLQSHLKNLPQYRSNSFGNFFQVPALNFKLAMDLNHILDTVLSNEIDDTRTVEFLCEKIIEYYRSLKKNLGDNKLSQSRYLRGLLIFLQDFELIASYEESAEKINVNAIQHFNGLKRGIYRQYMLDVHFNRYAEEMRIWANIGSTFWSWDMGEPIFKFSINGYSTDSDAILKSALTQNPAVEICDIGAGNCNFGRHNSSKFEGRVVTHNLNDPGYNYISYKYKKDLNSPVYIMNAENIGDEKLPNFHYIFSRRAFIHLIDPIGSLIRAYDKLNVNGIIWIDLLPIKGCEQYLESLISFLQASGYHLLAHLSTQNRASCLHDVFLQKTIDKPRLKLPLLYAERKNNADGYSLSKQEYLAAHSLRQFKLFNPVDDSEIAKNILKNMGLHWLIEDTIQIRP